MRNRSNWRQLLRLPCQLLLLLIVLLCCLIYCHCVLVLCVVMFKSGKLNGYMNGKGPHLSLFFVVMRGDYDALQTWPFQKKITMMLLDQGI